MSKTLQVPVKDLSLDLSNYRTVTQKSEKQAIHTMISMRPDRFWALTESLLEDGYLATENVLVLRQGKSKLVVKEGNRRIAALKLIHGLTSFNKQNIPPNILEKINKISDNWKKSNQTVPCTVYESKDALKVENIVRLVHGKGEKAGRDHWNAVARARYNRDVAKVSEPSLDLLEKYLVHGKNITSVEQEKWAGDYPLTVLYEAMKYLINRIPDVTKTADIAKKFLSLQNRDGLERLIKDIGYEQVKFPDIRNKDQDFGVPYGFPAPVVTSNNPPPTTTTNSPTSNNPTPTPPSSQNPTTNPSPTKQLAVAINNPEAVKRALKGLKILGNNRDKVVSLKDEACNINIKKTPLAFCFLLRSMFEISAKAYCNDHPNDPKLKFVKPDGSDRKLVDVLRNICDHITQTPNTANNSILKKKLHGAMMELAKPVGILSVTSLNQLIHNPNFSLTPSDISITFGNVFPLLVEMNS